MMKYCLDCNKSAENSVGECDRCGGKDFYVFLKNDFFTLMDLAKKRRVSEG